MVRMKVGEFEFEGTLHELLEIKKALEGEQELAPGASGMVSANAAGFVDADQAYEILTRRALSPSQLVVLRILYQAKDAWVSAQVLQRETGCSTSEFAGLMGAFGRRVSYTKGVDGLSFFIQQWDHEKGYNLYRLPETVREALEKAGLAYDL